ncbi:MAG: hypothetical protein AAF961_02545, partial [Planctomycetota bacterium]
MRSRIWSGAVSIGLVAAFSFALLTTKAAEDGGVAGRAEVGSTNKSDLAESDLAEQLREFESRMQTLRKDGKEELADRYEAHLRRVFAGLLEQEGPPTSEQAESPRSALDAQFAVAKEQIEALRACGEQELSNRLEQQLAGLRAVLAEGKLTTPLNDEPEVHGIQLRRGAVLPKEFHDQANRRTVGFGEVLVDYPTRPVVLVLTGYAPILWKIDVAHDSRLHAVVLTGRQQQAVTPPGTLVLQLPSAGHAMSLQDFTGRPVTTRQSMESYDGKPIVVGPRGAEWLSAYLLPKITQVAETAGAEVRRRKSAEFGSIRFEAIHQTGTPHSSLRPSFSEPSRGVFTLDGPIGETLVPLAHDGVRQLVTVSTDPVLELGLSIHGELVVFEGAAPVENLAKVPLGADMPARVRFSGLAYDDRRGRLVLCAHRAPEDLFAYDISDGTWSRIVGTKEPLVALAYSSKKDVYYGLAAGDFQSESPLKLIEIRADGKTLSRQATDIPSPQEPRGADVQLIVVDDHLVVLMPRQFDRETGELLRDDRLYYVDADSGEVVFRGPSEIGEPDTLPAATATPAHVAGGNGLLAQLDVRLAQAERDIERLREAGQEERAAALATRLGVLRSSLGGQMPKRSDERLFLVGAYESHSSTVRVTDVSGPITLVVCAYEASTWNIEADDGVDLQRIIVGGYHDQKLTSSPQEVPVDFSVHDQGTGGFFTYGEYTDGHDGAVERLKQYTPLPIATLTGAYNAPRSTILVGPEDAQWRAQQVMTGLDELLADANVEQRSAALQALRAQRFTAVHYGSLPRQGAAGRCGYLAEFSIEGPLIGRGSALTVTAHDVAAAPAEGLVYVRGGDEVWALEKNGAEPRKIDFDNELPRLSWPSGLAYDTKRGRLLLSSHGGGGKLYQYDVSGASWSLVGSQGLTSIGMAYAPDEDVIYALYENGSNGSVEAIKRYNPHGALLDWVTLSKRIPGPRRSGPALRQVAYFPGHVAVLTYEDPRMHRRRPGREAPESKGQIVVVNARSGEVVYEGEIKPTI